MHRYYIHTTSKASVELEIIISKLSKISSVQSGVFSGSSFVCDKR